MPSVFLSHSSRDKAFTRKLAERLVAAGVRVWLDEAELNVGDSLLERISTAIETADYVAAVISHTSVQSSWVQNELQLAMSRELADRRVRVLPILIEACELPMYLRDKLYADFSRPDDFDTPFARLLRTLGVDRQLSELAPPQPLAAPVAKPANRAARAAAPRQSSLQEFVDVQIIGVDKDRTYNPDPQKSLFNVYLQLSAYPPREWVEIFDAERRFPRHTMWRKAWVEGDCVAVYCVPEEIKKYHLRDVRQDLETSNLKYRQHLQQVEARRAREQQRQIDQRKSIDDALDDLDI